MRTECIKKRGNKCMKRGHKRERGSALDRREPQESQKQARGTLAHSRTSTHPKQSQSWNFFSFSCRVCAYDTNMIPSSFYSGDLSRLSFHKGVTRPVPSHNPSLHLGCVCRRMFFFFFSNNCLSCAGASPVFLNLAVCIFIAFVLTDILSFFFFLLPLCFEVAGMLVFRSVGIAIASPLSWRPAHTQLHTNTYVRSLFLPSLPLIRTCGCVVLCTRLPDLWRCIVHVCQVALHLSFVSSLFSC